MLDGVVTRQRGDPLDRLTRRPLLPRLITHQGYRLGETALIQGLFGRAPIDLLPRRLHTLDATEPTPGR